MRITFLGASNEVTGSCFLLETGMARLLVDCGMFQGSKRTESRNHLPAQILREPLDAVVLSHAHLDHCGRLPLLAKAGYRGPIYATGGTAAVAKLILTDAARIQMDDTDRLNRQLAKTGQPPVKPLFDVDDVGRVLELFRPVTYDSWHVIGQEVSLRLIEAGHILGSSSVELVARQNGGKRRIIFSGDIGPWDIPIVRNPATLEAADVVIMESTYGERDHQPLAATVQEFQQAVLSAVKRGGKILIPAFAVGRSQQILFHLSEMFQKGLIQDVPVYLDSPMAIAATELYASHGEVLDEYARVLRTPNSPNPTLPTLRTCTTAEESKALNAVPGPCIIIAGAGMCNAGRILHHLRHNLPQPETLVIVVGYQTRGSLGRLILEGARTVKIMGETVQVRATVKTLGGFSAHAGQSDLLRWLEPVARSKPRVVLVHGEPHPLRELAYKIDERFKIRAEIPKLGERIEI